MSQARFPAALSSSMRAVAVSCAISLRGLTGLCALSVALGCNSIDSEWNFVLTDHEAIGPTDPNDATMNARGELMIVGDLGALIRIAPDGTVATVNVGTNENLRAIALFDGIGVIVGDGATILVTGDDGETWSAIEVETDADLHDVFVSHEGHSVAVGDGVILRSIDGVTWELAENPMIEEHSLYAVGGWGDALTAVGSDGVILATEDSLTWVVKDSPVNEDLILINARGTLALTGSGQLIDIGWSEAKVSVQLGAIPVDVVRAGQMGELVLTEEREVIMIADGSRGYGTSFITARSGESDGIEPLVLVQVPGRDVTALGPGAARIDVNVFCTRPLREVTCDSHEGVDGRPFVVDGANRRCAAIPRVGWSPEVTPVGPRDVLADDDRDFARAWARDGTDEHASIASFARFVLELCALGAPASLIRDAQAALGDEIRHAELCFSIASALSGRAIGPGPLPIEGSLAETPSLAHLAATTFLGGCVNETIAAVEVGVAAQIAEQPAICAALEEIAEDESRHAALAWRTVEWALDEGGAVVHEALAMALAEARGRISRRVETEGFRPKRHRGLDGGRRSRITAEAFVSLVEPAARRLLDRPHRAVNQPDDTVQRSA